MPSLADSHSRPAVALASSDAKNYRALTGIETEYGILFAGQGPEAQIELARDFVRAFPFPSHRNWDYQSESPRRDLRGFTVDQLAVDPTDWEFESRSSVRQGTTDVRSDHILGSGARFYNDHGHPEFATPECESLDELVLHDLAGMLVMNLTAEAYRKATRSEVSIYKNNSDFSGASYGTHENFHLPRALDFDALFNAISPMLVARQVLSGAGKVGSEAGNWVPFQISARADFLTEPSSVETLFRRPIFNTRDEPHASRNAHLRLHVISGDANMMPCCTKRKTGLVRLAIRLALQGSAPHWAIEDFPKVMSAISRDQDYRFAIPLSGNGQTDAYEVLESYFSAAEATLDLEQSELSLIRESREILTDLRNGGHAAIATRVDWAAKKLLIDSFIESEDLSPKDPVLQSIDLEYHNISLQEGLFFGYLASQEGITYPEAHTIEERVNRCLETTRALPRGLAATKFADSFQAIGWENLVFQDGRRIPLDPDRRYSQHLASVLTVEDFILALEAEP